MALLDHFKKRVKLSVPAMLPNENGPPCKAAPSSSIREANWCVTKALQMVVKCKPYLRAFNDQKVAIGNYPLEHGIANTKIPFAPDFLKGSLKESTVHGRKLTCRNFAAGGDLSVKFTALC